MNLRPRTYFYFTISSCSFSSIYTIIRLSNSSGMIAQEWYPGTCWIGFSGCYLTAEDVNDISNISINQNVFDAIYPVGSIYMSVNSVNPSVLFGGTWETWSAGRVPIGVDYGDSDFNSVEKIGGNKKLQSHTHNVNIDYTGNSTHDHSGRTNYLAEGTSVNLAGTYLSSSAVSVAGEGNSQNLQPYITCYMWKRTA